MCFVGIFNENLVIQPTNGLKQDIFRFHICNRLCFPFNMGDFCFKKPIQLVFHEHADVVHKPVVNSQINEKYLGRFTFFGEINGMG